MTGERVEAGGGRPATPVVDPVGQDLRPGDPVDALLLVSFGGPEGQADVLPFLANVVRGRGVPAARLAEVAGHYQRFGGVSPINGQNRALVAALEAELAARGPRLPVYWGNRNWHPYLSDTVGRMTADGVRGALALVTSTYSSYSSCRQYREDLATAQAEAGLGAPRLTRLRHYYNHPGFVAPLVDNVVAGLHRLPAAARAGAHLAFSAHSIPMATARTSQYVGQLLEAARLVAAGVAAAGAGTHPWRLVFQSRSGPAQVPWLEPDVVAHLEQLAADGAPGVVLVPVGFISDHLEVVFDLDTEAVGRAGELGLPVARAATVGTDPRFVAALRDLVVERLEGRTERVALGDRGASHDRCPLGCCPPARGAAVPVPATSG